jgi:hypothetical protein
VAQVSKIEIWISKNRFVIFPLFAFVIPFVVRIIPEILMGPYVTGFDTLGFYIPNTLTWLHSNINWWSFLTTAPLFYATYLSVVAIAGSPVLVLKIISPVLLGFLGLSIFGYAQKGLGWGSIKSIFVAVLGTIYFVALRASWDQLREELGLVFLFVVLILLISTRKSNSLKQYVTLSLGILVVVLSHQLVSVLMFGVITFTVAYSLFRKDIVGSIKLIAFSLPAMLYFFIVYISGVFQSGLFNYSINVGSPLANWTGFTSYQSMLMSTIGLFLYCFLLILPLAIVSMLRLRSLQLGSWLIFSIFLMLLPITFVSPFRWVLMFTYPLAFYATDTLSRLKSIKWKHYKFTARRIAILYLVLSTAVISSGYIFMTPQKPFAYFSPLYFNSYSYQIPTSMLQNTISITDCQDTTTALHWFKDNVNNNSILLTHTVFYGWALLAFNENQVRNYGFETPETAAITTAQGTHSQIYLIWWVNGHGWYGEPTLPSSFSEVYHSGNIAIYSYNISL